MQSDPYKLIESAEAEDDSDIKRQMLRAAIDQLTSMDMLSVDASYALGYAWYLMPDSTDERRVQIFRHLDAALRMMPKHLYARLYMAHHYFDTSQFALALPILQEFGSEDFAARGQEWRDVKVAELILGCLLELGKELQIPSAVQDLLERANRVEDDAVPVPAELTIVLQRLVRARSNARP